MVGGGVHRTGLRTSERQRLKELEREVKELRRANDILRMASVFFAAAELDRKLKSYVQPSPTIRPAGLWIASTSSGCRTSLTFRLGRVGCT